MKHESSHAESHKGQQSPANSNRGYSFVSVVVEPMKKVNKSMR